MSEAEITHDSRVFTVPYRAVAMAASLDPYPPVHTGISAWLPCSPKDREAVLYDTYDLLDVPSTVYLASSKGSNTSVRFSIKLLHLASFVAPGSLAGQDLSHFQS